MRQSGTARTFLLVALGLAVAVLAGSVWYLATTGVPGDLTGGTDEPGEDGAEGPAELPLGAGGGPRKPRNRTAQEPGEDDDENGGVVEWGRDPHGDVFDVTPDSLRDVLNSNLWPEVCRQIEVLQRDGKPLPDDVVRKLLDLLRTDGRRLDAVMALGLVTDPATGRMLADLALDTTAPEEARVAALEALARSGQDAGFAQVQGLVEGAADDTPLVRAAYRAIAGMGGTDGAKVLLGALAAHGDDHHTDAVLTALAKLRGGDAALAQTLREARSGGDAQKMDLLLRVGTRMGAAAGPELRTEVRALVESPLALSALGEDAEARERLRMSAIYVASAMGGESLDAVIRLVQSESGNVRQAAVNSLRNARGDDAAAKIVGLLEPNSDRATRYEIASALGATASRKATPALHALLDDPDPGVREAAAASLSGVRDPESVPVILGRIDRAKGDRTMAVCYVKALGQIGVNDALPKLDQLAASEDEFWKEIRPWIRQAANRIRTGNPDATGIADRTK
jgi:HEAT repeat protein